MPEDEFVGEFKLGPVSQAQANYLRFKIQNQLRDCGYEVEVSIHPVAKIIDWRARRETDEPSGKQIWYLGKLFNDLKTEIENAIAANKDPTTIKAAEALLAAGKAIAVDKDTTKRTIGDVIDAIDEAIKDLRFLIRKVITTDEP